MLSHVLRILYLHGFASSPGSRKARFFADKLRERNVLLETPDLAAGHFERLTVTSQLELLERLLHRDPAILIGSSLGGYVAALYASRHPEIQRLLLLAPAFDFNRLWREDLGPERLADWERTGSMPVYHYAENRDVPLDLEFLRDASRYPPFPEFAQPALILHGNQDQTVPVELSVRFTETHRNARLVRLDSGHDLTDVLDAIWLESESFLMADEFVSE